MGEPSVCSGVPGCVLLSKCCSCIEVVDDAQDAAAKGLPVLLLGLTGPWRRQLPP